MSDPKANPALWQKDFLVCPLVADHPAAAIRELAGRLASAPGVRDGAALLVAIEAREAEGPTFLGRGLAMPHARTAVVDRIVAAVGTSPTGIPWGPNGERAQVIFALGVPGHEVRGYLDLVSRLTKAARRPEWIARVAACPDAPSLAAALVESVG